MSFESNLVWHFLVLLTLLVFSIFPDFIDKFLRIFPDFLREFGLVKSLSLSRGLYPPLMRHPNGYTIIMILRQS